MLKYVVMTPIKCQKKIYEKTKVSAPVAFTCNSVHYIMLDSFFFHLLPFLKTVLSTSDICPINLDHNIDKSIS